MALRSVYKAQLSRPLIGESSPHANRRGVCVQPTFWYNISIVMKKIDFPQPDWYTRNKKEVIP